MNNIRTNIYLTKKQHKILTAITKKEGISLAEQVRRAIDIYLLEKENQHRIKNDSLPTHP